ncbi:MAG: DNA-3-methyladenine glycosylase 2 family protein [Clostridia bacterium]|nr:DNA-3-methyladenine glycosylase 2 family protein [Clostridia bacterium]
MKLLLNDFNIKQLAESGECFRWDKITENSYRGVIYGKVCEVTQNKNEVNFDGIDEKTLKEYFDLNRDYSAIKAKYKDDYVLNKAYDFGYGIRIMNQEKFETLISFIISANNNIPRIKKSIEKISKMYGEKIMYKGSEYYAFPTPKALSMAILEELRSCGVGFRDKYILEAAKKVANGEINLSEISKLPTEKCKKELLKIKGVGPKVADCVMLFSMGKIDAFPIDVWIKRIMENLYIKEEKSLKEIEKYAKEKFGDYAGIAQQYLFYYVRENKIL